jgi:hypothetical protein
MAKSKLPARWQKFVQSIRWSDVLKSVLAALATAGGTKLSAATFRESAASMKAFIIAYPKSSALLIGVVALFLGLVMTTWKNLSPLTYGASEVAFGTVVASILAYSLAPNFAASTILGIASSVYIVSRGLNNVLDAIEDTGAAGSASKAASGATNP